MNTFLQSQGSRWPVPRPAAESERCLIQSHAPLSLVPPAHKLGAAADRASASAVPPPPPFVSPPAHSTLIRRARASSARRRRTDAAALSWVCSSVTDSKVSVFAHGSIIAIASLLTTALLLERTGAWPRPHAPLPQSDPTFCVSNHLTRLEMWLASAIHGKNGFPTTPLGGPGDTGSGPPGRRPCCMQNSST